MPCTKNGTVYHDSENLFGIITLCFVIVYLFEVCNLWMSFCFQLNAVTGQRCLRHLQYENHDSIRQVPQQGLLSLPQIHHSSSCLEKTFLAKLAQI